MFCFGFRFGFSLIVLIALCLLFNVGCFDCGMFVVWLSCFVY